MACRATCMHINKEPKVTWICRYSATTTTDCRPQTRLSLRKLTVNCKIKDITHIVGETRWTSRSFNSYVFWSYTEEWRWFGTVVLSCLLLPQKRQDRESTQQCTFHFLLDFLSVPWLCWCKVWRKIFQCFWLNLICCCWGCWRKMHAVRALACCYDHYPGEKEEEENTNSN